MIITGERRDEGGMRSVPRKDNTSLCFTETSSGQFRLRPLYYVTDLDKQWYKDRYAIKYSDAYEVYGLTRTGCCGCPISYKAVEDLEKIRPYEPNVVKAAWNIFGKSYEYRKKYVEYKATKSAQNKAKRQNDNQLSLFELEGKEFIMNNEISVQHAKALDLHNRIMVSAQLVQTNLWDMCNGLKEMRDGKLYKELGYQNFEEYCENECGFSRQQAHKYISIIENVKLENVNSSLHFGTTKLYLLSTLSEADQQKITAANDVSDMTVRELEQQIKELKSENEILNRSTNNLHDRLEDAVADRKKIIDQNLQIK